MHQIRWLAADEGALSALTQLPVECLALPSDQFQRALIDVGRTAFSSPLLLGGQAAKNGLSCQSCHQNGHANPSFYLEGLTGAPGTADVTSSIFSKLRGDGVFNPKPIPSLSDSKAHSISRDPSNGALASFVHGLIEEEFAGFEPDPLVFQSLLIYLRALDNQACDTASAIQNHNLEFDLAELQRALIAIEYSMGQNGKTGVTDFLLASAQIQIGQISARFRQPNHAELQADLAQFSRDLRSIRQNSKHQFNSIEQGQHLARWKVKWQNMEIRLKQQQVTSLYAVPVLKAFLQTELQESH